MLDSCIVVLLVLTNFYTDNSLFDTLCSSSPTSVVCMQPNKHICMQPNKPVCEHPNKRMRMQLQHSLQSGRGWTIPAISRQH